MSVDRTQIMAEAENLLRQGYSCREISRRLNFSLIAIRKLRKGLLDSGVEFPDPPNDLRSCIQELVRDGLTTAEISKTLYCHPGVVVRHCQGGDLPLRENDRVREQIELLLRDGVPPVEIANSLGVCGATVYRHRRRLLVAGVILPRKVTTLDLEIKELLEQGLHCTTIASRLFVSEVTVYRHRDLMTSTGEVDLNSRYVVKHSDGRFRSAKTIKDLAKSIGVSPMKLYKVRSGEMKSHRGWVFVEHEQVAI
jgi:DNA-binding CsgD family transcriptional regulator